jgi:rod shape-determining protein MreD
VNEPAGGYWVIPVTLLVAAVFAVLPLGRDLAWWRPEWLVLVLIYWTIALPHRVGLFTALAVGLLVDVLEGALIGQNMLALGVVVTVARLLYQRLRVFSVAQQALMLFVLVGIHQLIAQWVQSLQGGGAASFVFMLPALTSALLWPLLMPVLRGVRRGFGVR